MALDGWYPVGSALVTARLQAISNLLGQVLSHELSTVDTFTHEQRTALDKAQQVINGIAADMREEEFRREHRRLVH